MHLWAGSLEVVVGQKLKHRRGLAKASGVKDLVRIFAAAIAVSIVMVVLVLMIYWIQSILEFPKHFPAAILTLLRAV